MMPSTPILIEDNYQTVRVRIDGVVWSMGKHEYLTMLNKPFHFWKHELKRLFPQDHSCATCKNRPIDFCKSDKRINPVPSYKWKPDATDEEVFKAQVQDALIGNNHATDELKIFAKCTCGSWSRAVPFYETDCKLFEGDTP